MKTDAPCLGCTERHPLCWNDCEKYKQLVAQKHAAAEARRKAIKDARAYHDARRRKKEK